MSYIDSDCDQPIITSRTYNAINPVPYKLPEHKTRMTIKSKTHKGTGFNELRFEDEKDREEIFIHAQKDMNTVVLNDQTKRVVRHEVNSVGGGRIDYINNDLEENVGHSKIVRVGFSGLLNFFNRNTDSGLTGITKELLTKLTNPFGRGNIIEENSGNRTTAVGGINLSTVGIHSSEVVAGSKTEYFGGSQKVTVNGEVLVHGEKNILSNTNGDHTTYAKKGILVRNENAYVVMKENGDVEISGLNISIKASNELSLIGKKIKLN